MKLITLIEDTPGRMQLPYEHGLCIYVEAGSHKILVDTGASDLTWENAKSLGIDLSAVDIVIISHGHYDHTGGLLGFVAYNSKAQIYMQKTALGEFYHGERYIGVDKKTQDISNIHFLKGNYRIDGELSIFTNIRGRKLWPQSNRSLSELINEKRVQDQFVHEQCLVIEAEEKTILISGCAHNGILNIIDEFRELYEKEPDLVISGFHMMKKCEYTEEEIKSIQETAKELKKYRTIYYSGHCTGKIAFELMKEELGEQLIQLHSGEKIF